MAAAGTPAGESHRMAQSSSIPSDPGGFVLRSISDCACCSILPMMCLLACYIFLLTARSFFRETRDVRLVVLQRRRRALRSTRLS